MSIRTPVASGTFYESDFYQLEQQIKQCFKHEKGPGELPVKKRTGKVKAVICPHAGYFYSGPCAAWSYKEVAEAELPDCYIILGPNHSGMGSSSVSLQDWKTPLGVLQTDEKLGRKLVEISDLEDNPLAHKNEHSIEVQLPFLQFISKNTRILPISLRNDISFSKLAIDIKEAVMDLDREVVYIVSSDFTHYGATYGYMPFSENIKKNLYELDSKAIDKILALDHEGFSAYLSKTGATICGRAPLILLMQLLRKKGELLQYYTSSDIRGDYRTAVGYASIVFK